MTSLHYSYTRIASESVIRLAQDHYSLDGDLDCHFYVAGLHDNYILTSNFEQYIFRVYRNTWRSEIEIQFELELVKFLNGKNASVTRLVPTINNKSCFRLETSEGERFFALFRYAEGNAPGKDLTAEESNLLGTVVAQMHLHADKFVPSVQGQELDFSYLVDRSLGLIKPFLDDCDYDFLCELREEIYPKLSGLDRSGSKYGICAGDINANNFHINFDDRITLFDFDQCGYGYRSFEIAKLFSSLYKHKKASDIRASFLEGYQQIRRLDEDELAAIPLFEIVAVIWVMAINAENAEYIGYKHLQSEYWDQKIVVLRELCLHIENT
ncbi:MAG: phosphotransferase [Gammaproteobacteria bacterium]|nr:phosphotransferase [Gammaproteobacteria bacterium]